MIFKEINLQAHTVEAIATELMFEIAGARVDKCEVLCVNMFEFEPKQEATIMRTLKELKKKGLIQFFATRDSFLEEKTEAIFMMNKYSSFIDVNAGKKNIYIML